jgi:hypothetical protein
MKFHRYRSHLGLVVLALPMALVAGAADASRPVPRTVVACVTQGVLTDGRYTYRLRSPARSRPVDLSAFEGMTLRVRGNLLPGDVLIMKSIEIIADTCTLPR